MPVRPVGAGDLAGLDWLDDGTRAGLAVAVAAGADRALVLGCFTDDGEASGVLAADLPPWRDRRVPWLWLVDVRTGCRGRGIGTALLVDAHGRLAAAGHRAVELSVDDGNERAIRLYLRLGYVRVGVGVDHGLAGPRQWTRMRLGWASGGPPGPTTDRRR